MTPLLNVIGLIVNWVTGSPEAARKKKGHGKDMRAETTGSRVGFVHRLWSYVCHKMQRLKCLEEMYRIHDKSGPKTIS